MTKVLHVVPSFGLGGMEKVICALINGLPQTCQHEILSLDSNHAAKRWLHGQNVHFVDFQRPSGNFPYLRALFRVLRDQQPDMLMTYNWGATDAVWLGRLVGMTTIVHSEHGFNVDEAHSTQWKRNVIRFIVYRLATKVIVVSRALHVSLKSSFGLTDRHVAFIPNGIDTAYYSPDAAEGILMRRELGLGEEDFVVGFAGRLDPVKNFDLLLKVFASAVQEETCLRLVLVGDGPEREKITTICQQRNLQDHVLFIGQTDNVLPYLRIFDVFVLTSFREQMPMSLLEAMSVGVPVVASCVGEIPHMVKDGKEGFLCDLEDLPQHWAMRLLSLRDPEKGCVMGKAARDSVVERFQARSMLNSYQKVLANNF